MTTLRLRTLSTTLVTLVAMLLPGTPATAQDCPTTKPSVALKGMMAAFDAQPFHVTLSGPDLERAAPVLEARITGAGGRVERIEVKDGLMHVKGALEGGLAHLEGLLQPGHLGLHPITDAEVQPLIEQWRPNLPPEIKLGSINDQRTLISADRAALEGFLKSHPLTEGRTWAIEDGGGTGYPRFQAVPLGPMALGESQLSRCDTRYTDRDSMGMPHVNLTLTPEGARTFEALTRAQVGKRVAIVIDGEVNSAPTVREPIPGGRLMITLGMAESDALRRRKALALVGLLRYGALPGALKVQK
ncbi:MAG: SecDF P1 head subdomain-containing protein [Bradymonadia bacterium]